MDSEWRRRSQLDVAVAPMVCCWEQWRAVFRRPTRAITVQLDDCPSVLVNTPGHKVSEAFRVRTRVGKGGFSTVKRLTNRRTGAVVVMKEIRKSTVSNLQLLQEEVKLQASMDHPHIARVFETFEDEQYIDIIMESCEGGNVLQLVESSGALSESDGAYLFRQLVCALSYMHHCQVVHRDIKPENLVLKEQGPVERATVKLIDFGFARSFKTGLKTICGTPLYVAPEVFSGHYTSKCDLWSCGMTLFHMLTASPPFTGDLRQILRAARRGLEPQALARLASEEAKEVVASLCSVCPLGRPSACSLLQGQWLLKREREVPREEIAENLQHYSEMHPVKKAVLKTIVHVIEDKDIQCLREAFESLDTHGEGSIPVDTLHSTIASSTRSTEADSICGHLEKMDYSNWLSANVQPQQYLKEGYVWEAFRILDKDSSGKISFKELLQLAQGLPEDCEHLLAEFDKNGDGEIDFEEFLDLLNSLPEKDGTEMSPVHSFRVNT